MLSNWGQRARGLLTNPLRRFQLALLALLLLLVGGTLGYMMLEGMDAVEALYMTVITITTVGFGEVRPLSSGGRVFTIVLIVLGVGAATTAISNAVGILLGPRMWLSIQKRRIERRLMDIEKHYVVCGYGRMGQQIVRDLRARDEAFLVIDSSAEMAEALLEEGIDHLIGDATQDETLHEAHIERARGLVAALNSDADNVMTVLTARELNPGLFIVARAATTSSESKMRRAGANRVVSPYNIGGHRMALALLRPAVHDFLNLIFDVGEFVDVDIGQVSVDTGSRLAGQTVGQSDLRRVHGLSILAVQRADGQLTINPSTQHVIQQGETLIVIGPPEAIYTLEAEHEGTG